MNKLVGKHAQSFSKAPAKTRCSGLPAQSGGLLSDLGRRCSVPGSLWAAARASATFWGTAGFGRFQGGGWTQALFQQWPKPHFPDRRRRQVVRSIQPLGQSPHLKLIQATQGRVGGCGGKHHVDARQYSRQSRSACKRHLIPLEAYVTR